MEAREKQLIDEATEGTKEDIGSGAFSEKDEGSEQ